MTDPTVVYLGLGSNLGNRESNLDMALKLLGERMRIGKRSSYYDTEPIGNVNQPRFLNLVVQVYTRLTPQNLLKLAKGIELRMGRHSRTGEPRPIDIDILLFGNMVVKEPDLVIPHPRMHEREFVLAPLAEIAADVVNPLTGDTIKQMREAIKEKQGVFKWETT
jgi:2-amino-4-hydroxy-6-hydroxymethyldihydropteridine diphosphokinase